MAFGRASISHAVRSDAAQRIQSDLSFPTKEAVDSDSTFVLQPFPYVADGKNLRSSERLLLGTGV